MSTPLRRSMHAVAVLGSIGIFLLLAGPLAAQPSSSGQKVTPFQFNGDLRRLPQPAFVPKPPNVPRNEYPDPPSNKTNKTVVPKLNVPSAPMPNPSRNFAGLSSFDSVTGGQAGGYMPPDVNGDVGRNHYIESVNESYAIYDKTGTLLTAFTENSLWATAGSNPCNGNSFGDPVVLYDQLADRWILTNMAFSYSLGPQPPFYQCIAVSKTSDPVAGGWWLYALRTDTGAAGQPPVGTLNDYAKFGVWNDHCLYMSANGFAMPAGSYVGAEYASFSLQDMEAGLPVTWALGYISNSSNPYSMLPSNLLGVSAAAMPPAGTPNYFVSESGLDDSFEVRKFIPGANCGGGGSLGPPVNVSHSGYTYPGNVSQPNTTNTLDSLGDRLMQKLQYRKVGSAESLWLVHSVRTSNSSPVTFQWAQLDVTGGVVAATPLQQQIYTPDTSLNRWMPSIAADRQGNVAIGFSTSNGTVPNYPSIAYSGRLATDPVNNLSQSDMVLMAGLGSQTVTGRWGDYTAMSVDPTDDCTFWYINEYYSSQTNGTSGNWQTRIGSFKFPGCSPTTPELAIAKSHVGSFTPGQNGAAFTIVVSNAPQAPSTTGTVTVTENVPNGVTLAGMTGTGWSCTGNTCTRADALAGGQNYPAITATVNIAPSAAAPLVNSVSVSGGGSATASATDNILSQPALLIAKSHTGNFIQGQTNVTYNVTVSNGQGAGGSSGMVSVTDNLPSGLTLVSMAGTGWVCANGTCTRSDSLAGGASYPVIIVTVNVSPSAASPQLNSVSVSGGGSPAASATDSTTIVRPPPSNDESATAAVVTSPLPYATTQDTTGATTNPTDPVQSCVSVTGRTVWFRYVATYTGALRLDTLGTNYDTVLSAYVGSVSAGNQFACNDDSNGTLQSQLTIQVTSGQAYYFEVGAYYTNPGGALVLHVSVPPALNVVKSHSGNFTQGQTGANYTVSISNISGSTVAGTVTVTENPPSGLTLTGLSGSGWSCNVATSSCSRSDGLAIAASFPPITVTVDVASNASSPLVNSVSVAGGSGGTVVATDSTTIQPLPPTNDEIATATAITDPLPYSLSQNTTLATVNAADPLQSCNPTTTKTVWFRYVPAVTGTLSVDTTHGSTYDTVLSAYLGIPSASSQIACNDNASGTYLSALTIQVAAGQTYYFEVGSSSGYSGGTLVLTVVQPSLLSITKTHTGSFRQGQQGATYKVVVSNAATAAASAGTVTVTDNVNTDMTLVSMGGTGWNCTANTCTRSDSVAPGASYPAISVVVNIASDAPTSTYNRVTVSGGSSVSATAYDYTTIVPTGLAISKYHSGDFAQGMFGATYTVNVYSPYGSTTTTSGTVTVTENLPSGLTLVAMAGTGWSCAGNTCSRSDVLLPGYSFPNITVTVNVTASATSPQVNSVTVSGGGVGSSTATDSTNIVPALWRVSKTHSGTFVQGQLNATYTVTLTNPSSITTSNYVNVWESLPSGLTMVSMAGNGWTCPSSSSYCYRSDPLAAGASYPPITVTVNVAANATSPQVNAVMVSGGGLGNATGADATLIGVLPPPNDEILTATTVNVVPITVNEDTTLASANPSDPQQSCSLTHTKPKPLALQNSKTVWFRYVPALTGVLQVDTIGSSYDTVLSAYRGSVSQGNEVACSDDVDSVLQSRAVFQVTAGQAYYFDVAGYGASVGGMLVLNFSVPPSLRVTKTHTGIFNPGQVGAVYNILVSNATGAAATSGTVTVIDTLPAGLTLNSISGTGWTCTVTDPSTGTCTRTDVLAAGSSYPNITASVTVSPSVAALVTNQVSATGGGSIPATASDPTQTILSPVLTAISPSSAAAGNTGFFLVATGANFAPSSVISWVPPGQGTATALPTTYVNSTRLQTSVPANLLLTGGMAQVSVVTAGVTPSSVLPFLITDPTKPLPVLSSISPNTSAKNASAFTMTSNGSGFQSGASIWWTGPAGASVSLPANFMNSAQLLATIPANLLTSPGIAQVSILNPVFSLASPQPFLITDPASAQPSLGQIAPSVMPQGGANVSLTATGSNFVSGATIWWTAPSGASINLPATFLNSSQLQSTVPASLLTTLGTAQVAILNPGFGLSSAQSLQISTAGSPMRINMGGPSYGQWASEYGCTGGGVYAVSNTISGTSDQPVYQDLRFNSGNLVCSYAVPNGYYSVKLKLAELYWTSANQRVFDVQINGVTVDSNVDVFARAGGTYAALDLAYPVTVTGGQIAITLVQRIGMPSLNGIEISASVPDFSVAISPPSQAVSPGSNAQYTVSVSSLNGFNGTVGFTLAGLPANTTYNFNPQTVTGSGLTTLTVTTTAGTPVGTYNLTLTGTSGTLSHVLLPAPQLTVGSFSPVYVNTGGTAYGVWAADTGCQTTNAATYSVGNPIAGTTDQTLYQSLRYGLSNLTCTYSVPAGNYRVRLKFAELYWTSANQRVFDVQINGVTVDTGVDPFTRAGGIYRAVDGVYNVTVSGSQLAITLVQRSGLPAVNGIEIQSVPYTPVLVNVGGPAYSVWSADSGCSNGTLYSVANAIGNTADQQVYQTLRYSGSGSQNCSYAVPNGSYTVKLKLAELYWTVTGQRVFDVQINGTTVDTNLDLFGRAGAVYRAYDPSYTVTVTGGQINISLVPRIGLPSLNGVDIR